jgi:energy-coupling factor transporter ATP-binding protein EcfA2
MSAPGISVDGEVVRLPTEPYPGLRPFLNHEAMLLLGRERQVREVIARLQQTQFVAVIGGSGSGKSSLVLAGVVPELRSFGIPGAGDFWLPMVCTPGTNVSPSAAAASQDASAATPAYTPITRLAWKFAMLLKPAASPEAAAARLADIAAVFRQEAGFARLVDTYADEMLVRPGPAAESVRLLFVLDQFEELFHPTNKGVEDARLMVERVIDHFFNPHPRCFVVLTMRSEHLNDCAGYLELPDAINKSSYLVRRLDEDELREAIVGPAQRFLRLLQRRDLQEATALPESVEFEPQVVDRLLRDVSAITHDPDHLPLLQHLLARLWEAAFARERVVAGVPAKIIWDDLRCAVLALAPGAAAPSGNASPLPFDDAANALRASLENWAEAVYLRHSEPQRVMLDAVLRRLAFKDPNTGMYTQQRIDVDDASLFGGAANPRQTLRALIEDGFIGSVDYLFWDDENPQRVTLKVSHESFIRGWSRFRKWADEEDRQFQVYLRMLDDCDRWVAAKCSDDALSGGETLRAYQDASLEAALGDPDRSTRLERLLQLDRDGARVAPMVTQAQEFLTRSLRKRDKRVADREADLRQQKAAEEDMARAERDAIVARAERDTMGARAKAALADAKVEREKIRSVLLMVIGLVLGVLGLVVFSVSERSLAKRERTLHRGYALAAETQVGLQPQMVGFDAAQVPLRHAQLGAYFFQSGRDLSTGWAAKWPLSLFYAQRIDGLQSTELLGEVRSIASLRSVLLGAVWPVSAAGAPAWLKQAAPQPCGAVFSGTEDQTAGFGGAQFYAGPSAMDRRGLIVATPSVQGVAFFVGRMDPDGTRCDIDNQLINAPPDALQVGAAADLSSLVFEFETYFQVYAIVWGDPNSVQSKLRVVIQKLGAESLGAGDQRVKKLPSAYSAFATDIKVADRTLRVFDFEPTPIAAPGDSQGEPLEKAPVQGVCAEFAKAQPVKAAPDDIWSVPAKGRARTYCLQVQHARGGTIDQDRRPFLASLYAFDNAAQAADPNKHLPLFSEEVVGTVRPTKLRINIDAEWLAFEGPNEEWRAIPWGLRAWRGLANGVVEAHSDTPQAPDSQPFSLLLSGPPVARADLLGRFPVATDLPVKIGSAMGAEPERAARALQRSMPDRSLARPLPASAPPAR